MVITWRDLKNTCLGPISQVLISLVLGRPEHERFFLKIPGDSDVQKGLKATCPKGNRAGFHSCAQQNAQEENQRTIITSKKELVQRRYF